MIKIQTGTSSIVDEDGRLSNGIIIISANTSFEFVDVDTFKKKVSIEPLQIPILNGKISVQGFEEVFSYFYLVPTLNASQDKQNLHYTARFLTETAEWSEYWVIDGNGADTLEITDITQVTIDPSLDVNLYVTQGEVSATPGPNLVPRASSNGKLNLGWIDAVPGAVGVYALAPTAEVPDVPPPQIPIDAYVLVLDLSVDQVKIWDGTQWRTIA